MLVIDEEGDGLRAELFRKVAQVHERALCEEREVQVAQPDEEAPALRLVHARVLVESLGAAEARASIEEELARALSLTAGHQ